MEISWDEDENADGFIVYRSTSENGTYAKIGSTKNNHLLNIYVGRKDYYYKVVAYQSGQPTFYSEESAPVKITVTKLLGIF